jgi:hypothetical protein
MKAHKYLKPRPVISAIPAPLNLMEIPAFFTVTSPDDREIHYGFPDKLNKK